MNETFKDILARGEGERLVHIQMTWARGGGEHAVYDQRSEQRFLLAPEEGKHLASFGVPQGKTLYVAQAFFWGEKHHAERPYCVRPTDVDFYVKWNRKGAPCPVRVWWEIPNDPALKWPEVPIAKIEGAVTLMAGFKGRTKADRVGFWLEGYMV